MRDIALNFISFSYERVFHEKMGDEARGFIKNLSYIVAASGVAAILSTFFNIFAGRILGPEEYGEFTLIQTIAMFLLIPMMPGIDIAMITYTAEKKEFEIQSSIISTSFFLVIFFTLGSVSVYYYFTSQFSEIFSISKSMLYLAIIYAFLSVICTFATGALRSLHKMKEYAVFQPLPNFILLLIFLVFFFSDFISFKSALISMFFALGATGSIMIYTIRKYLKSDFKKSWAKKLVQYGSYASLGGLASVFYGNIDKIIINKYFTTAYIGIYRSYYFASISFVGLFIGMFIAVFYPMVCKYDDKKVIFNRVNKTMFYLLVFGLPSLIFFEFVILKLYGSQYPLNLELIVLFGIGGILTCMNSIYSWLLNAIGTRGVKIASLAGIIIGLVNIILNFWLIPLIGMLGAVIAINISYIAGISIILLELKHNISTTHN